MQQKAEREPNLAAEPGRPEPILSRMAGQDQLLHSWHCPPAQCGITLIPIHPVGRQESQQIHSVVKTRGGAARGHDSTVTGWIILILTGVVKYNVSSYISSYTVSFVLVILASVFSPAEEVSLT